MFQNTESIPTNFLPQPNIKNEKVENPIKPQTLKSTLPRGVSQETKVEKATFKVKQDEQPKNVSNERQKSLKERAIVQ